MKEDILEQLVDEYLQHQGYFTRHNIKFKPDANHLEYNSQQDSVSSDIDVIGINPNLQGPERVMVVTCKSWQQGFRPHYWIKAIEQNKIVSGREAWRAFRELSNDKWGQSFIRKIQEMTGSREFTYVTAVTAIKGDRTSWETCADFTRRLENNKIKLLTFEDMLVELYPIVTTTQASSTIGRVLQLIKASGWK
jgi:hypothetical protein